MKIIKADFPFEEIKDAEGNMFFNWGAASIAGYPDNQIWSVIEGENDTIVYGPPHHYVNNLGYIATAEAHDGETYYHEDISDIPSVRTLLEELAGLRQNGEDGPLTTTFMFCGKQFIITINESPDDDEPTEEELEAIYGQLGQC